jgi:hypothetical protein
MNLGDSVYPILENPPKLFRTVGTSGKTAPDTDNGDWFQCGLYLFHIQNSLPIVVRRSPGIAHKGASVDEIRRNVL